MASSVPSRAATRMASGLKKFQPILSHALDRDINESDTVDIITDMLAEIFGFDKYVEVTSEYKIRGTYCDLAIEIGGQLRLLIEVKAIGIELKEAHLRQAVNYAANQGLEWVALTNGIIWKVYRVEFTKPIKTEFVVEIDLLKLNYRKSEDIEAIFLLSREGFKKSALPDHYTQKQATGRHVLGAILVSEPILNAIRRELRKISPEVKVTPEQVRSALQQEVMKREVVEGEKAIEAAKKVQRLCAKEARSKKAKKPQEREGEDKEPKIEPSCEEAQMPDTN